MKPIWRWSGLGVWFVAACITSGPAEARGFFAGLGIHTSLIGTEDRARNATPAAGRLEEVGGGATLQVGYQISRQFPLRLVINGSKHKTSDPDVYLLYSAVTLEGAYVFQTPTPLKPYLLGGLGGFSLDSRRDALRFETTGPGTVIGAGFLYSMSRRFELDFSLRGELINWDESRAEVVGADGSRVVVEMPVEENGSGARLGFGVLYRF